MRIKLNSFTLLDYILETVIPSYKVNACVLTFGVKNVLVF